MKVLSTLLFTAILALANPIAADSNEENAAYNGEETRSLAELYAAAVAEGGKLVYYAGGDIASQSSGTYDAFTKAFPKINLTIITDYSKFHDVRIDNQLATNSLEADVASLQTLEDFPRWESEGKLLAYKPAGFSQIYAPFKSSTGAWMSLSTVTFSMFYDPAQLNASKVKFPTSPADLVDPIYKNRIASPYPHDDDAVLFVYSKYVEKYGWDWVANDAVSAGNKSIALSVYGSIVPQSWNKLNFITKDIPYLTWGQRIAIFKKAPHPAAAKLFLNWIVSKDYQTTLGSTSVRTDIPPQAGYKFAWEYANANTAEFAKFMNDRANIERLRFTFALYFGEVQGPPSPGVYGVHPKA
ncbi:hypothetical protein AC1031_005139 [Aphanomyces cochlioides]|nr:hypothetical protein AC1031_005139 [Aphanomyces cochlioides]